MKKIFLIGLIIVTALFMIRFFFGGDEDTWICEKLPASAGGSGEARWVKHGNPDYPAPVVGCNTKPSLPKNEKDCLDSGGVWGKIGIFPQPVCNRKAVDRGILCRDNSQCEGTCQVDLTQEELSQGMRGRINKNVKYGQCSVWVLEMGCQGVMKNGKVQVICAD